MKNETTEYQSRLEKDLTAIVRILIDGLDISAQITPQRIAFYVKEAGNLLKKWHGYNDDQLRDEERIVTWKLTNIYLPPKHGSI